MCRAVGGRAYASRRNASPAEGISTDYTWVGQRYISSTYAIWRSHYVYDTSSIPVNAIIDPLSSRPNKDLQDLATGTRYLLVNDYVYQAGAQPFYNWLGIDDTPLVAHANDIIEFDGSHWGVVFDSAYETQVQYVTNLTTEIQYRWYNQQWQKSWDGIYPAGEWSLVV